jgi:hypothetical protein
VTTSLNTLCNHCINAKVDNATGFLGRSMPDAFS